MLEWSAYDCIPHLLASTVMVMRQTRRTLHCCIEEDLFKSINFQETDQAIVFDDFEFPPTDGLPF